MGTPEDTALHGLRVSAGQILDNFGFTQISDDSMEVLSDIMRRFIKKMAMSSKLYAEHAGRSSLNSDDLYCAFKRMKFSTSEMYHFFNQNSFPGTNKTLPKFPAPRLHSRPLFHPQPSEKELETRPEHIPKFLQAAHPEWTRDGADYLAVMKPSTSVDKKGAAPDFPSFMDFGAKDLGISKDDRKPVPRPMIRTDESSATGITSSANLSSQKLNNHYDHPAAPPMFKRKTKNGPFNGLKDSRSSTPIGRSNSPYNIFDRIDIKTEFSMNNKEDKPKLKPRPSIKMEQRRQQSPAPPPVNDDGGSSPMPTLELIGGYTKDDVHDLPATPKSESDHTDYNDRSSPPRVADSALAANIILFQQLKAQEERENQKRSDKEKENEQKQRKKEESQRKKEEKQREKERIKREKEEKKRRDEEARLEKERRAREKQQKEKERRETEEKERKEKERKERDRKEKERQMEKAEAERKMILEAAAPRQVEEVKSLKIVISNPMSNHASSAFSPPSGRASSLLDNTSTSSAVGANGEDDADTIPFVEGSAIDSKAAVEFPLNISVSTVGSPSPTKKKHKKKDKERDRSSSPHKKHKKKDKEHKKKRKRDKERDEDEHRERKKEKKEKRREEEKAMEKPEQKITLKIRLGDQTPSQSEISTSTPSYGQESVKLKFKNITPDTKEEKVPPLRLGVTPKEDKTPEKPRLVTKAELKAPAFHSHHSTEKEEKQKRREEKKRREREEAERKQKEQLEMFERQHEEKKRKEAEEKNRREEEIRRINEAEEKRRRKEREQKEREEKERLEKEKERQEKEKEAARKEKEKEKERKEKERRESLPAPVVAHVTTDPSQKKKHKKERREERERLEKERLEKERQEKEKEKERERERERERAEQEQREREREQARQREAEEQRRRPDDDEEEPERIWICPACSVAWAEGANMVACDMCDDWFHWACVGLLDNPTEEKWFCRKCSRKRQKRPGGGGPGGSGSGGPPSKKRKRGEGHGYLKT